MSGKLEQDEVIIPNLKRRFSGITSTMIQVLPQQKQAISMALIGNQLEGVDMKRRSWSELLRGTRQPLEGGYPTIFHARRNDDMVLGLLLKFLLRRKLHLVFTSVAQRPHTALTRFLYGKMDTLLSTSPRSASYLRRKPDAIIPHGIDTETFRPAADRDAEWKQGGLPGKYGIGIFGRVRRQKGIQEFVEAMCEALPRHPDYTAVIVGEATPEHWAFVERLKSKIARAGLSDRFAWLGKLPFAEIPVWFRRMSLVVAASQNEGFGLTCLEAMASGAPVVATRAGGFEMVVREGVDGRIVPCKDPAAIAQAVDDLLSDRKRLEAMGIAARERVLDAFTIEREVAELVAVYRGIQESYTKEAHSPPPESSRLSQQG